MHQAVDQLAVAKAIPEACFLKQVRSPAHAFHAAGNRRAGLAAPDKQRPEIDGLERRGADLVDGQRGHGRRQACQKGRLACGDLSHACGEHRPHDHLIDILTINLRAVEDFADDSRAQLGRGEGGKGTAQPAKWRAGGGDQDHIRHDSHSRGGRRADRRARRWAIYWGTVAFKNLLYGRDGAVATITINRPDRRNALNPETVNELRAAFLEAKADGDARVIVLTGAGKTFCAGADLESFRSEISELDRYFQRRNLGELFIEMTQLGKPTIARVNGHALAGGLGLAVACDLGIASLEAQLGIPEVNVGVWPMLIMASVFRNVPRKAAMELMLTGKRITAEEAARLGVVNRAVPADRLNQEVDALAQELAGKSPLGMRLGLEAFYRMQDMSYPSALAYLEDQLALLGLSEDLKEGVNAFFEKREPRFTGR